MNTNIIRIPVTKITQLGEVFFIANVEFSDLKGLYKFSIRSDKNLDAFNRFTDQNKIKKIAEFISKSDQKKSKIPLFVTPIILGFSTDESMVQLTEDYLVLQKDLEEEFKALVVDGQHRLLGIESWIGGMFSDKKIEIPVVFLIDYSEYQLAEIFANINFTQKPVNKSLYYDIFGSSPFMPVSEIRISHLLIRKLNSYMLNIFSFSFIKMLPNSVGTVSQGFFGDKLNKLLRNKFVYGKEYKEIEQEYKRDGKDSILAETIHQNKEFIVIEEDLKKYFSSIYKVFGEKGVVFKTNGIGAFLRLIEDFYLLGVSNYEVTFKGFNNKDIFQDERYSSGSESVQTELYKIISRELFYQKEILSFNEDNMFHFDDFKFKYIYNLGHEEEKILKKKFFRLLLDDGVIKHEGEGYYLRMSDYV